MYFRLIYHKHFSFWVNTEAYRVQLCFTDISFFHWLMLKCHLFQYLGGELKSNHETLGGPFDCSLGSVAGVCSGCSLNILLSLPVELGYLAMLEAPLW